MTLKAVFFDIDDTLFSTGEFVSRARRAAVQALRAHGVRLPAPILLRELDEVVAEFASNYEHHFDKLLLRLPAGVIGPANPAILVAACIRAYHDTKPSILRPYPDVPPVLRRLARTRLVRGVITAGLQVKQAEKLLRLGLYPHLTPTAIFISDQIGISKPNVKLYRRACDAVGVRPSEALYVGDHPTQDIDPANELGMITAHIPRGRHASAPGKTRPDYRPRDFKELLTILRKDFKVRA